MIGTIWICLLGVFILGQTIEADNRYGVDGKIIIPSDVGKELNEIKMLLNTVVDEIKHIKEENLQNNAILLDIADNVLASPSHDNTAAGVPDLRGSYQEYQEYQDYQDLPSARDPGCSVPANSVVISSLYCYIFPLLSSISSTITSVYLTVSSLPSSLSRISATLTYVSSDVSMIKSTQLPHISSTVASVHYTMTHLSKGISKVQDSLNDLEDDVTCIKNTALPVMHQSIQQVGNKNGNGVSKNEWLLHKVLDKIYGPRKS
jgi:archaellum component FlaC